LIAREDVDILSLMKRVLCVEDHKDYVELIQESLKAYEVISATSIKEAKALLEKNEEYDCIILDLSLPDGDGLRLFSLLREKAEYVSTPVVFLTHSDEIEDKVAAFQLGAVDYLTKPIHPLELKTRIDARLKQAETRSDSDNIIEVGNLKLNLTEQSLIRRDGNTNTPLELTAREWKLLLYMAQNKARILSREQILEHLWPNSHVVDRTIDTHISNLRKKICPTTVEIKSVPGLGYKLIEDSEE
jgi:two-component system, OmpR family, alkaline phosphatase synthesis response regulator PhoP